VALPVHRYNINMFLSANYDEGLMKYIIEVKIISFFKIISEFGICGLRKHAQELGG
jgi:hypothetical protein